MKVIRTPNQPLRKPRFVLDEQATLVAITLDPNQDRQNDGLDLDPNCLTF